MRHVIEARVASNQQIHLELGLAWNFAGKARLSVMFVGLRRLA